MSRARRRKQSTAADVTDSLFHQSAGVEISGDPGSGKTNAMKVMMQTIIRRCPGQGLLFITPEAKDAREMYDFCLDQGPSVAARTIHLHPSDTRITASFNPLSVPGGPCDDITLRARRTNKMDHVSNILLTGTGNTDGFNLMPLMRRWLPRVLTTTSAAGLPLPEAYHFVDTASDIYSEIIRAAPEAIARNEFAELAAMKPADREAIISSTKNRIFTINENPVMEAALGRVDCFLRAAELIRRGYIVIANLERGGVLREIDQELYANLLLTEFLHDIFNMPESDLRPYFVFVDELPVFKSSAPLLTYALARVRKYMLRIIGAHQGTTLFPDRTEDPLLHAMVSMCGVHLYFAHCNPVDARFFGEVAALPSYSPTKVKHVLKQKVQYQAGNDLVILQDKSETRGNAQEQGGSQGQSRTATDNWNDTESNTDTTTRGRSRDERVLHETVNEARAEASGRQSGHGGSTATADQSNANWSRSTNRSAGRTRRQTLVPRLKWREIVASIQFLTPDEHTMQAASRIANLGTGEAIVHISRQGVFEVLFPKARTAFAGAPNARAKKEAAHFRFLTQRPEYASPQLILTQRRALLQALLTRLRALPCSQQPAPLIPTRNAKATKPVAVPMLVDRASPLSI